MTILCIVSYNERQSKQKHRLFTSNFGIHFPHLIRACTGFDGGFEVGAAIRRLLDCVPTGKLNINADEQYALAA